MEIYLATRTAGQYGGALKGKLRYFDRLIQDKLDNAGFVSTFDVLYLTLSYSPMYVLPGVVGIEIDYKNYYNTLPISRIDRRYKQIDITLKASEFSEYQQKIESVNYQHRLDIEERYKNIPETKLAKILIDKYLEAGEIINSKLKRGDRFDIDIFKHTLTSIKEQIDDNFINSTAEILANKIKTETISRAIEKRDQRKQNVSIKDKIIRDLRIYYFDLPEKEFYPYDYQYIEIFRNILRRKKLMCPTYHHLYIRAAKSMDDCLLHSSTIENWYIYGLSTIDYNNYIKQDNKKKEQISFNTIVNGLMDIATIDKLDITIIEEAIEEIKQKGLDTELEYATVENKKHKLTISYFSRSMEEKCPIYFTLLDKASGHYKKIEIGRAEHSRIHFWLQKVNLTNTHIKVKSSSSIAADVYLENMPRNMEFSIKDFINE
jgi:hypothetical protein